jgi:hypothetical protein
MEPSGSGLMAVMLRTMAFQQLSKLYSMLIALTNLPALKLQLITSSLSI